MKTKDLLFTAGIFMGCVLLILTAVKIGWIPLVLFALFLVLAVQDATSGKINLITAAIPIILMAVFFLKAFLLFLVVFVIVFIIWLPVYILRKKGTIRISQEDLKFGFGDVLAIPYALALAWILSGFWGLVVFAAADFIMMFPMLRRKNVRLIPWLVPGVIAALIIGVIL